MELEQNLDLKLEYNNKEDFLNTTLWRTINNGIDIGIRYALPDLVEDEFIDIKDNLIKLGLKEGIKKSIDSVVETGKNALGLLSGNFENIKQFQSVIKNGGILDKVSDVIDLAIKKAQISGKIDNETSKLLQKEKESILSSVERNIESTLTSQISSAKNVDKYIEIWKKCYENKDFEGMQNEYIKMQKEMKKLVPIENTINNARYVENIHNLIKNNGKNFELTEHELDLAGKL